MLQALLSSLPNTDGYMIGAKYRRAPPFLLVLHSAHDIYAERRSCSPRGQELATDMQLPEDLTRRMGKASSQSWLFPFKVELCIHSLNDEHEAESEI